MNERDLLVKLASTLTDEEFEFLTEKLGEGHIAGAVNATAKGINKAKGLAHDYIIDPVAKRVRGAIDDQRIPRPKLDEHGKEMDVNYYGDLALQEGRLSNLSGESSKMIGDVAGHGAAAGIVGGGALAAAHSNWMCSKMAISLVRSIIDCCSTSRLRMDSICGRFRHTPNPRS